MCVRASERKERNRESREKREIDDGWDGRCLESRSSSCRSETYFRAINVWTAEDSWMSGCLFRDADWKGQKQRSEGKGAADRCLRDAFLCSVLFLDWEIFPQQELNLALSTLFNINMHLLLDLDMHVLFTSAM